MAKKESKTREVNVQGVTMPHNLEAEQAILGCLLIDNEICADVIAKLDENDFYLDSHKRIFEEMRDLNATNFPIDFVTLTDKLESDGILETVGGIEYITDLTRAVPSSANYDYYLDIVKNNGLRRKIIKNSAESIANAQDNPDAVSALSYAEKKVFDLSSSLDTGEMVKVNQVLPEVLKKFDTISKDKNAFRGLDTGFKRIDYITHGLQKTDLILIAARPSVGKTSFAMNIVENIATTTDKVCAVFSLEMGKEQLTQRMLGSIAGISMQSALDGTLTKEEWLKIAAAREKLAKAKVFIDDSTLVTPSEILSKCRRIKKNYGLDLIMIDYIQLMKAGSGKYEDNRQQEVSEISRNLKIIAKELQVPVVALSQLSRDNQKREDHTPQLADIRESGAIEQDADIVMLIHNPDHYATQEELATGKIKPNVRHIIIAKHRNGSTGTIPLFFKGECTKFMNIDERDDRKKDQEKAPDFSDGFDPDAPVGEAPPEEDDVPFDYDDEPKTPDDEMFG
ncbi:MAG: replicative DNA helicase [Clostridia bacterium]|nr:replicative DNA helicase [Clostridia bacterium]